MLNLLLDNAWTVPVVVGLVGFTPIIRDLLQPKTEIGVSSELSPEESHGIVWVEGTQNNVVKLPFKAFTPSALETPSPVLARDIWDQIEKMELVPLYLEIRYKDRVTVYKYGVKDPVVQQ